ncbi:helix-turn-helix domain-containing protein [Thioalkalivibrio sp. ALJT]
MSPTRPTGLHHNTVSLLYKEAAVRIELDAMDKLCELFEYIPEGDGETQ